MNKKCAALPTPLKLFFKISSNLELKKPFMSLVLFSIKKKQKLLFFKKHGIKSENIKGIQKT